ncbi:MAG: ABC transporter ATP-binding protein [Alphaproteobacteria bacterium]|nr:ABC transporter ATP-binding protein [Alphaproteobacteria bacterium]
MTPLVSIRDLVVTFAVGPAVVPAVRGVAFDIWPGRTTALVGESGSGKSVLSQAIMRILPSNAAIARGSIVLNDPAGKAPPVDLVTLKADGAAMRGVRGGRISLIFQEPMTSLSPLHTVGDQVGEALHLHRRTSRAQGRELTIDMLRLVGFPDPAKAYRTYPFELSGGLRQRAMIAMALICRPSLLIADEPTTALDVTIQAQILKLIGDLQAELGMAVLLITHDLGVVANMAEDVVVMYHGEAMESGTAQDIFRAPEHPYLKALLRAVPRFAMAPGERLVPLRAIEPPHVETWHREPWPTGADAAGPLLDVQGLCKSFTIRNSGLFDRSGRGDVAVVSDVSFAIARGECLGLVGESGCGKTTTSKMILRALSVGGGTIRFNDRGTMVDVASLHGDTLMAFRRKVQFIFQDPFSSLNPRMTVLDILAEPFDIHGIGTREERLERVKELMRLVGLDVRHLRRYPHSFSGGQRQRIGIARALALGPDLLVCDEPVSALDVSIQAQILNLLKDLQERLGLTYLFISHNLAVVDYIADRIAVMCAGRIVETAPASVLFADPVHPYTRALVAAVPEPSLDRRLDFDALMAGRASDPGAWPEPFAVRDGDAPGMIDLGDGHLVRARPNLAGAA